MLVCEVCSLGPSRATSFRASGRWGESGCSGQLVVVSSRLSIGCAEATAATMISRQIADYVALYRWWTRWAKLTTHRPRGRSILIIAACLTGPDASHHDWAVGRHPVAEDTWVLSGAWLLSWRLSHGNLTCFFVDVSS